MVTQTFINYFPSYKKDQAISRQIFFSYKWNKDMLAVLKIPEGNCNVY